MSRPPSLVRNALALLSVRLWLRQIGLALLVFLLSVVWLRIPDASALDVAASVLLALAILAIAGAGESSLMLRLVAKRRTPARLLRGTVFLLIGFALWYACGTLIAHLQSSDVLRAGYLNSRFPASLRNFFSFEHILIWQQWIWTMLLCLCAGFLALFAFAFTSSDRPLRTIKHALRTVTCWLALIFATSSATVISSLLLQWTPGHGLRVEMLSLIFRLSFIIAIDALLVCFVLTVVAACVLQAEAPDSPRATSTSAPHIAPSGTPDESQPRTAGNP